MGLTPEQKREIYCVKFGHSKIIKMCFGYVTCARCDSQIGDCLGASFDVTGHVIVGHNCEVCRKNLRKLTARDKMHVPRDVLEEIGVLPKRKVKK